jgi:hypothetical protein
MNTKFKRLIEKLKKPNGLILAIVYALTIISCVGAISFAVMQVSGGVLEILGYVLYGISAVSLGYSVYTIVIYAGKVKGNLTRFICKFKFGQRLLSEYGFRTVIFATMSLIVNLAYVALHVILMFVTRSYFWYGSLALYYALLVALRGGLVLAHKNGVKERAEQIKKYRNCGIILTILPVCLLVPILQTAFLDKAFSHEGLWIFAFAAYAFYKITMAIINLVKSRKECMLTVQAVRCVGFADALVSIFSLQTALLFTFSENANYGAFNIVTGLVVFVLTVCLGAFMIRRAKKLKDTAKNIED